MKKGLAILLALVMVIAISSVGFAYDIECMYGTPVIDGVVDEVWSYTGVHTMVANDSISGTAKALWDETYIYFLYEINDANQFSMGGAEGNDSIEVWLDETNADQAEYGDPVTGIDFHYRIDIDGTLTSNKNDASDAMVALTYVDGASYIVEIQIPIHAVAPAAGVVMGFSPSCNTDDDGDGSRDSYIYSCESGGSYYSHPADLDNLVFVESKVPVPVVVVDDTPVTGNSMVWVYVAISAIVLAGAALLVLRKKVEA